MRIPRDRLVVITGLSGSGKSSLAFDTLYAEGQRRYVESLSAYARQFLDQMEKPDVECDRRALAGDLDRAEDGRAGTRARPSAPPPRSTTTCACSSRAPARRTARAAATRSRARASSRWRRACSRSARACASTCWRRSCAAGRASTGRSWRTSGARASCARASTERSYELGGRDPPRQDAGATTSTSWSTASSVKEAARARIAESIATALRLADGAREARRSATAASRCCSPSATPAPAAASRFPEIAPRFFSFNSPAGACPACDGLGTARGVRPGAHRAGRGAQPRGRRHRAVAARLVLRGTARGASRRTSASTSRRRGGSSRRRRATRSSTALGEEPVPLTLARRGRSEPREAALRRRARRARAARRGARRATPRSSAATAAAAPCAGVRRHAAAPRGARGARRAP